MSVVLMTSASSAFVIFVINLKVFTAKKYYLKKIDNYKDYTLPKKTCLIFILDQQTWLNWEKTLCFRLNVSDNSFGAYDLST